MLPDDKNPLSPKPPIPSEPCVFISYSHHDSDAAKALAELLQSKGVVTWLDRREMRPEESFQGRLDEALRRCDVLLVLVSSAAQLDTEWRRREWSAICERTWAQPDVRVVPILLDDSELPAFLSGLEAFDCSNQRKMRRCVEFIPRLAATKPDSLAGEEREKVAERFRKLLEVLPDQCATSTDSPPKGTSDELR